MLRKEREAKEAKRDEAFTVQIFKSKKTVMMNEMITNFAPITLGEMKSIKLMNRLDKKFVTTYPTLLRLLEMTKDEYMMQVVDGERNMHYDTVYFDTNGYDMFYTHQAGWMNRQKLRFRTYVSSSLQFMEIKTKNGAPCHNELVLGRDYDIVYYNGEKFEISEHKPDYYSEGTNSFNYINTCFFF